MAIFENTQIKKKINPEEFAKFLLNYQPAQIECTPHTFFRLNQKQRKIFTCKELKRILINEKPFLAGIQHNKNYAIFYKYQNKNLRMILKITNGKINIVTFYFIKEWQIPKI